MLSPDVKRVALRLMSALDTPRSLTVKTLIENGEWDQLFSLSVDPSLYEPLYFAGVEKYRRDVQATDFLRKLDVDDEERKEDLIAECWSDFLSCERECYLANRRLAKFCDGTWETSPINDQFMTIVKRARSWLLDTLGPVPSMDKLMGRFGPGGTFESELWPRKVRNNLVAYDKLQQTPMFTLGASGLWSEIDPLFRSAWGDFPDPSAICRGDRFSSVAKTAVKRRPIALGPGFNVFLQLAVNDALVPRLSRRGIHVKRKPQSNHYIRTDATNEGQMLHRKLARISSCTNDSATVDLSSASDLNAYKLIQLLLDWNSEGDWFALLCKLRSPVIRFEDRWLKLEKFSAMGNGFTFPLETLVFCALLHGVGCRIGEDTYVYGDDMIIPRDRVGDALAVLKFVGHRPNLKKTYTDGYFRESCGGDFLKGQDVRPYFLKKEPSNATNWISVANALWRRSIEWQMPELAAVRNACLDNIPTSIRGCRGPEALGDLVVWDHPERWNFATRASCRYFRVWRPVVTRITPRAAVRKARDSIWWEPHDVVEFRDEPYLVVAALMGYAIEAGLSPRDKVEGYRFGRVVYS